MSENDLPSSIEARNGPMEDESSLSEPKSVRRWFGAVGFVLLLAVVAAGGAIVLSSISLRAAQTRTVMENRLEKVSGLPVSIDGETEFSLLPSASITLSRISIGPPDGETADSLQIDRLHADLDLWSALLGRVEMEKLTLVRPQLGAAEAFVEAVAGDLERPPMQAGAASGAQPAILAGFAGLFSAQLEPMPEIEIRDGVFRLGPESGAAGISNANLTFTWPNRTAAARLSGSYVWNGQPSEIELNLDEPRAFLQGETSRIEGSLSAPALQASFDGKGYFGRALYLDGDVSLRSPSLSRAIDWLGNGGSDVPDFGTLAITANLSAYGPKLQFQNASVQVGENVGRGAGELLLADHGVPQIDGTFAFEALDLDMFVNALAPYPDDPLDLTRPISVSFADEIGMDVRVSASTAQLGRLDLKDFAATLQVKDGLVLLDIGDAALFGGRGQARMRVETQAGAPALEASAALEGVDLASLLETAAIEAVGLSGPADIQFDLTAPVSDWASALRHHHAEIEIEAWDGVLHGLDPTRLPRAGSRPFVPGSPEATFAYERLKANASMDGPLFTLDGLALEGPGGRLIAEGTISARKREIAIEGLFNPSPPVSTSQGLAAPAAMAASQDATRFRIHGGLAAPQLTVEPSS